MTWYGVLIDQINPMLEIYRRLPICLGVPNIFGSEMCYWIVTGLVKLITKTLVENVTREDYLNIELNINIE